MTYVELLCKEENGTKRMVRKIKVRLHRNSWSMAEFVFHFKCNRKPLNVLSNTMTI